MAHKPTISIHERFAEFVAEAKLADELGFDYFFTTEHHFSGDFSLSPSQPVTLGALTQATKNIRIGPMIVNMTVSDPLRVAEEILILDHMSNGRLEIGLGRGSRVHEHVTFGVRTETDRARLAEGIDFVVKALTTRGNFSSLGEFHQYFDVELPWEPLQKPYPPVWVPTLSPDSARSYALRGFHNAGIAFIPWDRMRPSFEASNEAWAEAGHPPENRRLGYMASTIVAETDEEARRLMYEHFPHQVSLFEYEASRSYAITGAQWDPFEDLKTKLTESEDRLAFLCGSPETVAERIGILKAEFGMNVYLGEFAFGLLDFDDVARSMRLFMDEVMPRVNRDAGPSGRVGRLQQHHL